MVFCSGGILVSSGQWWLGFFWVFVPMGFSGLIISVFWVFLAVGFQIGGVGLLIGGLGLLIGGLGGGCGSRCWLQLV